MFSGIRPDSRAGGDDRLFGQRLAQPFPVLWADGPDADLDVVRSFASALYWGFHDAVPYVDGKHLSPAGVGTTAAEPGPDAELHQGLHPAFGPPIGSEVAPAGRGSDAAPYLDGTGIFVVVIAH